MPSFTSPIAAPLEDILVLEIDPLWTHIIPWESVFGTQNTLTLTFLDLEQGIEEVATPNYTDSEVIGRAEGYKTYVGTGNKEIPLTFSFWAQGEIASGNDLTQIIRKEVIERARWIERLKFPFIDEAGVAHAPPPLRLTIGQLITQRVIVTDASIKWLAPFTPDEMLPHGCEISCTFTVVNRAIANYNSFFGNMTLPTGNSEVDASLSARSTR